MAADAYDLDQEWQRRFPAMNGTIACPCALKVSWQCHEPGGGYVEGHLPAVNSTGEPKPSRRDFDAWCHIGAPGTHVARVLMNPRSGLIQGAEEYLRYTAQRRGVDPVVAERLQAVLKEWDAAKPGASGE
ncbi:hypothetical protein [Nonomuraea insulae]|uniref:Uncharacterized protein n=1 Tax=Nonomuraea insulae TaxID=1616787 RepID=A0ABW1CT26_9ACTN